jgi:hypothetical protein
MEVRNQGSGRRRAFQLETLEGRAFLSVVLFAHRVPAVIEAIAHSVPVKVGSNGHAAVVGNMINSSGNIDVSVAITGAAGTIRHPGEHSFSTHPTVILVVCHTLILA